MIDELEETNGCEDLTFRKLTREEINEAKGYDRHQIRSLVDLYYSIQKVRIGSGNKDSAYKRNVDTAADPWLNSLLKKEMEKLEKQAERGLRAYVNSQPLGRWCMSILGINTVLTAGLMAHIDLKRCCCTPWRYLKGKDRLQIPEHDCPGLVTAGAILKFAGQLPRELIPWEKGQLRPYNKTLKTLCYKIGTSFTKLTVSKTKLALTEDTITDFVKEVSIKKKKTLTDQEIADLVVKERNSIQKRKERLDQENALYIRLYMQRKEKEVRDDENGLHQNEAFKLLEEARRNKRNISPEQHDCWSSGHLQPIGLDRRAARYAVKIFLCHYHEVGRKLLGLPVVAPWVMVHGGHSHYIQPPNLGLVNEMMREIVITK